MAALDVAGVISRWLKHVANDGEMLDRTEMMYSDMYSDHSEMEEKETSDGESSRCCRCSCPPGTRCVTQEPEPGLANSSESVLSQFSYRCGCREVCYTFQGQKVGRGQRTSCDGSVTHCQYRRGCLHGLSRTVSKAGPLTQVGWWRHGGRTLTWWTRLEGGGWLVTNDKTSTAIFLYPDLVTALTGALNSEGTGLSLGDELGVCQVTSLGVESGILLPGLVKTGHNLPVTPSISSTVEKYPEIRDPYENKIVEVKDSLIPDAGKGLFTRKHVSKGLVVAYFAGVKVDSGCVTKSEFSISWLDGAGLDIPVPLRASYCATLGHKACHSFAPNCEYGWAVHPRWGRIRAVVSLRSLEPGEEILTDYKYSYHKAPQWYRDDLNNFLVNNFNMGQSEIADYIQRIGSSKKKENPLLDDI